MAVQFTSKQFLKEMKKIKKKSLAMDNSNKNPMKAKYDFTKILGRLNFKPNSQIFSSNIDKIKQDAIWNDENQRWRIPDLITQKTKLPPAGKFFFQDLLKNFVKPRLQFSKNLAKSLGFTKNYTV